MNTGFASSRWSLWQAAWPWVQRVVLALLALAGSWKFVSVMNEHYPIREWLFWRLACCWVLSAAFSISCLLPGMALLQRVLGRTLPVREHLTLSFGVGVMLFFLTMFFAGAVGLYRTWMFPVIPMGLSLLGARSGWRYFRRLARHRRYARKRHVPRHEELWLWPVVFAGAVGVLMLYASTLVPNNLAYDVRWYHMAIAEQYSIAHRMTRFDEGWFLGSYPHLMSFLYTWAFLLPGGSLYLRTQLAAHLETTLFLWTLAAIPALVRRLLPTGRVPWAWAAVFLFPEIFIYDSNLNGGADHVTAFWGLLALLALLRAWERLEPGYCLLLAVMLSGALDTKYSAVILFVPMTLAVLVRVSWRLARRQGGLQGVLVCLGTGLVLTAPHWAKNWYFYGDPLYPMLYRHFHERPWFPQAEIPFIYQFSPEVTKTCTSRDWAGVKEALVAVWTYAFKANDWYALHADTPLFGSLFALTTPLLPFLWRKERGERRGYLRLVGLFLLGNAAVFLWYSIHHFDRYLQALVPWMAAGVVAVLLRVGRLDRKLWFFLMPLVALQAIWGGDVYFFPTHSMEHTSSIKALSDFLAMETQHLYEERFRVFTPYSDMAKVLPQDGVVLIHEQHMQLGIGHRTVSDWPGTQGGIDYGVLSSPKQVYDLLKRFGVTHVLRVPDTAIDSDTFAGTLAFLDTLSRSAPSMGRFGLFELDKLSAVAPTDRPFGDKVAFYSCNPNWKSGLYHRTDMLVYTGDPRPASGYPKPYLPWVPGPDADTRLISPADYLLYDPSCRPPLNARLRLGLIQLGHRDNILIFRRL